MGNSTTASGLRSTAMGRYTTASGNYSTAMGNGTTASGSRSTAMGAQTNASGTESTAMGRHTTASGYASTAMGRGTVPSGQSSTAMGYFTTANGDESIAMGHGNSSADRLVNNITDSLMVGFDSNAATLYVGPSAGGSTTGNVGIGTSVPARKLHISEAMRIEPQASAPAAPSGGDLYVDNTGGNETLCIYLSGSWSVISGAGACI